MRTTPISLLALLICFACACDSGSKPAVIGKWKDPEGAIWEFKTDGTVVARNLSPFKYELSGENTMNIDFQDADGLVITYIYELSEGKMIIKPETVHSNGTIPLDWNEVTVFVREGSSSPKGSGEVLTTDGH
ncbi:MAG: hypothetical protein M3R04_03040 [bacterium]|nr:hypothetical protein [bacterium]